MPDGVGAGGGRLGLLYARLGVVVSEVAALPLCVGRADSRKGLGGRRDVDGRGELSCQIH